MLAAIWNSTVGSAVLHRLENGCRNICFSSTLNTFTFLCKGGRKEDVETCALLAFSSTADGTFLFHFSVLVLEKCASSDFLDFPSGTFLGWSHSAKARALLSIHLRFQNLNSAEKQAAKI